MQLNPIRLHAHNPGPLTGSGTFTYLLIGADRTATLVDAGQGKPGHLDALAAALTAHAATLTRVLVTHAHGDHIAGAPHLAAAYPSAAFFKWAWPEQDLRYPAPWQPIHDGQAIDIGGATLVALHTPGHAPDHLAFWHARSGTVFVGDLVWPGGTVMIPPSHGGDLIQYLAALERLRALRPARLLPAHGEAIEQPDRWLARTIEHRLTREQQVLEASRVDTPRCRPSQNPSMMGWIRRSCRPRTRPCARTWTSSDARDGPSRPTVAGPADRRASWSYAA
jgi:glyoxylase-like metal-dependent hydrolase (beta-lactamase superfamily II)